MEAVIDQVKRMASNANEVERKEIIDGLRDLSYSLETPDDTLHRVIYLHLQISSVRVGCDLKLFNLLAASDSSLSLDQLHKQTGAAPIFLGRLCRYLASVGMIKEVGKDKFAATNVTKALSIPGNQAGVYHQFNTIGPVYQEMPDFLAKINYTDITDTANTAHQAAWKSSKPPFAWLAENPQHARYFNDYMMHRRQGMVTWLDVYPIEKETKGWSSEAPVFVDIGGNIGHQCAELKSKYPKLPGQVILQDLPQPISQALSTPGVKNMVHDAFEPEPVKGARFYYMRAILHDWPDHKCREILQNIIPAMGPDSAILLDEMVLPDTHVHWQSTQTDITMMASLASIERTKTMWADLLDSVGLKIEKVLTYTPSVYESIMTVIRK
ncbi:hypothetical protein ABVK25_008741 [Lepraria finkii]|uniref:O-methyltransferase domain-containing protein n=1 Tax=Lepraria finkii TaxID=1340010 RepID=A0ABR4AZT4_9LECA